MFYIIVVVALFSSYLMIKQSQYFKLSFMTVYIQSE